MKCHARCALHCSPQRSTGQGSPGRAGTPIAPSGLQPGPQPQQPQLQQATAQRGAPLRISASRYNSIKNLLVKRMLEEQDRFIAARVRCAVRCGTAEVAPCWPGLLVHVWRAVAQLTIVTYNKPTAAAGGGRRWSGGWTKAGGTAGVVPEVCNGGAGPGEEYGGDERGDGGGAAGECTCGKRQGGVSDVWHCLTALSNHQRWVVFASAGLLLLQLVVSSAGI